MWRGEYDLLEDVHSYIQWLDPVPLHPWVLVNTVCYLCCTKIILSPADFVRLPWQRNDQSIILMVGLFEQSNNIIFFTSSRATPLLPWPCVLGHCHAGIPILDPFSMPWLASMPWPWWYMAPSIVPLMRCRCPVPLAEKHPESIMFPPPCLTVGMVFLGL